MGRVLLADDTTRPRFRRLLVASDAFTWCGDEVTSALQTGVDRLVKIVGPAEPVTVAPDGLEPWLLAFRMLQGAEIWAELGRWIRAEKPNLAPDIRQRFEWTSTITEADVAVSQPVRKAVANRLSQLLGDDAVLCLPTTPGIAPLLGMAAESLVEFRNLALSLLCIAGLARLPQINLPVGTLDGCPCGLSIVGPHGSDVALLQLAADLADY